MMELVPAIYNFVVRHRLTHREFHILLVFMILGFSVIIDLANGFLIQVAGTNFSLGILYRGSLLLLLFPFVLVVRELWVKLYIALVIGLWLILNPFWLEMSNSYSLEQELVVFSKVLYAWIVFSYLSYALPKHRIPIEYPLQCMVFFGAVAGLSILFSYFTGYGISTYSRTSSFAVKSYFKAQNDIGLTMLLSLTFCMYLYTRYGKWIYGVCAAVIISGLVLLGTRAGTLGGFGVLSAFTGLYALGVLDRHKRSGKRMALVSLLIILLFGGLYYAVSSITEYRYLYDKYISLLEESPRENLISAADRHLADRGRVANLIGEGSVAFNVGVLKFYTGTEKEGAETKSFEFGKSVEQDIYDMIGPYGLVLGSLILIVTFTLFLKLAMSTFLAPNFLGFTFTCAFGLYVVHAVVAGHALVSATVGAGAGLLYYFTIDCARKSGREAVSVSKVGSKL